MQQHEWVSLYDIAARVWFDSDWLSEIDLRIGMYQSCLYGSLRYEVPVRMSITVLTPINSCLNL